MTFFKEIELIYPYLKSIRKLKEYLSFDVQFPVKWKIPKKFTIEGKFVTQEKQIEGTNLVSFIAELNESEVNKTVENIKSIVEFNKEIEQKERLFSNKVEELKKIFEAQDIGKLQTLKFEINEFNLDIKDEGQAESDKLVEK
jgi:hypothetical protein